MQDHLVNIDSYDRLPEEVKAHHEGDTEPVNVDKLLSALRSERRMRKAAEQRLKALKSTIKKHNLECLSCH